MGRSVSSRVCVISNDQLIDVEELALGTLHMSKEKAQSRFSEDYEDTRTACFDGFECKGMFAGFAVEGRDGDEIRLEGGTVLKSQTLAELLQRADEVVLYAVCTHGCDAMAAEAANAGDLIAGMFYDAWGSGFTMAAHRWLKRAIADAAHESGRHVGKGWVPGEEGLEMHLQKPLLERLDPSQIGLSFTEELTTNPRMSVCGIMGVSDDEAIEGDGAERIQHH